MQIYQRKFKNTHINLSKSAPYAKYKSFKYSKNEKEILYRVNITNKAPMNQYRRETHTRIH